jgi:hypothetical protein
MRWVYLILVAAVIIAIVSITGLCYSFDDHNYRLAGASCIGLFASWMAIIVFFVKLKD